MPIPILIAGAAGVMAGIAGVGGHLDAKETNQRAEQISRVAQNLYYEAEAALEAEKRKAAKALQRFGYTKKAAYDGLANQFIPIFNKIKACGLDDENLALDELSKYSITSQDVFQLQEMSDVYQSVFSSGVAGMATGAAVALAANGMLTFVTDDLLLAGAALSVGQVSAAAGLASSALAFGISMTPLAAVVAPVVLFTGFSASTKADENLEKAKTMRAEAEAAAEKMEVSKTLCKAVAERSDMFNDLLRELSGMCLKCTAIMEEVFKKKESSGNKKWTREEAKLFAVARSLAGSVKAIIEVGLIGDGGNLSEEGQRIYSDCVNEFPNHKRQICEVESYGCVANTTPIDGKVCYHCGNPLIKGKKFCTKCGTKL